jgi:hypothetical protein
MTISRKTALFISLFIVVIMFLFLYLKSNVMNKTGGAEEDPCDVGAPLVCSAVVNASGVVWGPCNYTGSIKTEPPIRPLQKSDGYIPSDELACVAAGVVGNKTWAVIKITYWDLMPPTFPSSGRLMECAKKICGGPCAVTLVPKPLYAVFVVDVDEGVGYYTVEGVGQLAVSALKYEDVVFSDAVYLKADAVAGAPTEIFGEPHRNCFIKMRVWLERDRLILGKPLRNATGTFLRVPGG